MNGMQKDISVERAKYINRQNNLNQEFYFAHPVTKFTVNRIYNTDFTGSPLWDFTSDTFESLGKTWNVSVRIMFNLPRTAHRYLLEPLTGQPHIQFTLMKRFIKFCDQLRNSEKNILKTMMNLCENNSMTKTGHNLRTILLLTKKNSISQIQESDFVSLAYKNIPEGEEWRVQLLKELIDIRHNPKMLQEFSYDEIDEMISQASTT